jgi:hypothetical protein
MKQQNTRSAPTMVTVSILVFGLDVFGLGFGVLKGWMVNRCSTAATIQHV